MAFGGLYNQPYLNAAPSTTLADSKHIRPNIILGCIGLSSCAVLVKVGYANRLAHSINHMTVANTNQ